MISKNKSSFQNLIILGMCLGLGLLSGCSHGGLRETYQLAPGMQPKEVKSILGTPDQETPDRFLYYMAYSCTKVPYYIHFKNSFAYKFGTPKEVTEAVNRQCAGAEDDRRARATEADRLAKSLQSFGTPQFNHRIEPLMQNCWQDFAGWHCM